ncbi:putative NAD-dependent epimerase/dehydratase [Streptomyces lydicamycinicus]|uniref:Putative NAD-dependent epimerase/dehydratase n=1 Tax=Streptomyces lydicamycinicus TaxID=1546107 RepID=A0A0P4REK5_9ACTN|nr:NAD-dependent epimerase/dehydratase family protein [Streptomyces lydicamycinicus]GAO11280.1 putative NAD-dependent epimerase/dehydratase [Streptomyces lydicamycinicus]
MKMLVLGGTLFLSRAIAEEGVRRGHEVVCAARGTSGQVPEGATLVKIDRDRPDGLEPLAGQKFDAVVDVAAMSYPWVRDALSAIGSQAGHWTFISSINVYADAVSTGQNEDAALHEPVQSGADQEVRIEHPHLYGSIKVASENAVREAMGDRAFIVRSGLIVGPGDLSDRFGYWVARIAKGGRVAVPDSLEQPTQYVDVRDMAAWIVDAGERGLGGTYNGVGPTRPLGQVLAGIAEAVGPPDTELVPVPEDQLEAAGVQVWRGDKSLPLWVPPVDYGFMAHDHARSAAAGFRHRPFAEVVAGVLAYERELGLDRERKAGLTPAEEAELLELVKGGQS